MLQLSLVCRLFSKPITQGYVAQLPPPPPSQRGYMWMRAAQANSDVRDFFTPDAERYDAWYRETYHVEDFGDGSAASGVLSNRVLDDTRNMRQATEDYDLVAVEEEAVYWDEEFRHNRLVSWSGKTRRNVYKTAMLKVVQMYG